MKIDDRIETMDAAKVMFWLDKTGRSISNYGGSSNMETNTGKAALCRRYSYLKDRALELRIWEQWCNEHGWAIEHDGFDAAA